MYRPARGSAESFEEEELDAPLTEETLAILILRHAPDRPSTFPASTIFCASGQQNGAYGLTEFGMDGIASVITGVSARASGPRGQHVQILPRTES
ncbi:hypothetical protein [Roseibium sp. Sym1]|uniref:hypothetical protein n=1 Tax=Roseibium sp. Sym1 TaxID=3016006 RepID=UPI0022B52EEF|nr:hypothetical protein [Roseibium sp. Sym1]